MKMLSNLPKTTQLIREEPGFELRQPDSTIHVPDHVRRRKTGSFMTFHHCHQRTGHVPFRACKPGVPVPALHLGMEQLPSTDPQQHPCNTHDTSVVKGHFLLATSPGGKATNPDDRRNERHKRKGGASMSAMKTNVLSKAGGRQEGTNHQEDIRPTNSLLAGQKEGDISLPGDGLKK